jgi:hypothetical protein
MVGGAGLKPTSQQVESYWFGAWRNTDKLGGRTAFGSGGWSLVLANRVLPGSSQLMNVGT